MNNTIFFVRHGQTVANVQKIISGTNETELTQLGIQQAKDIAITIKERGLQINTILTSPLKRALDTAAIISNTISVPYVIDKRLLEHNFGIFQGQTREQNIFLQSKSQFIYSFGTGETMFQVVHRVYSLLDELSNDNHNYLLVSHNGISRVINSYFFDMTNEQFALFSLDNCEVREYLLNTRK